MSRRLVVFLLLAAGHAASAPDPGRLFLTPAQRQAIDRQRLPVTPAAPRYVDEVKGPCGRTIWLAGQRRYTGSECGTGRPGAGRQRP
jgi:hypothetical protein